MRYELATKYDARKSFGHKAIVEDDGTTKTLISYTTEVAKFSGNKLTLLPAWNSSPTTYRHVVEFAKQTGTYDQLLAAKKDTKIEHDNYEWKGM